MRGRIKFQIFKPILKIAVRGMQLFPKGFCCWLLVLLRYVGGVSGIGLRYVLLKRLALECGDNVSIHDSVFIRYPEKFKIGKNVSIHPLCYLDAQGDIEIGDDVSIAHNVSMLSFEHNVNQMELPIKDAPCLPRKIKIENDVWIGAGVRILGGVTVGKGSAIGANAVVTKDIPPSTIAVGVPARVSKTRGE